jgi:two-component system chemotaxis response regulator CheB
MAATIGRLLVEPVPAYRPERERDAVVALGSRPEADEAEALAGVEAAAAVAVDGDPTVAGLHGTLTGLTCPECGGALRETRDGALHRFTCKVGHSYSVESMLSEQGRALESTLSGALRALEERADLLRRLARRSSGITRRRFEQRSRQADEDANRVRATLLAAGREPAGDLEGGGVNTAS